MTRREKILGKDKTKTNTFLLPMLGINWRTLPTNFFNAYITEDNKLALVFEKDEENIKFNKFLDYTKGDNAYITYEEDLDEIILYYEIPIEFHRDYDLFLGGQYSKFSDQYKDILLIIHGRISIKDSYHVSVVDTIKPQAFKRKQIADRLNVDINLIEEVFDKPELKDELFVPLNELLKNNNI